MCWELSPIQFHFAFANNWLAMSTLISIRWYQQNAPAKVGARCHSSEYFENSEGVPWFTEHRHIESFIIKIALSNNPSTWNKSTNCFIHNIINLRVWIIYAGYAVGSSCPRPGLARARLIEIVGILQQINFCRQFFLELNYITGSSL